MYRIVPRTEYGLPATVTSSDGSPRPPLSNERWMTAHYTGNNVDYTDKVTREVVLQIQRVFSATKPFEYNYVIGQENNNEIYEFAGKYTAAHSAGENADSFGVLFLLGVGEDPTPVMISKWRWLRDVLKADGSLSPNVEQLMHYQMPGAATACPGNIKNFWPEFLKPFHATQPPLPPPTYQRITMASSFEFASATRWDTRGFGNPIPAGQYAVKLDGSAGKVGATFNLTIVSPTAAGYASAFQAGSPPNTSKINFATGQAVANEVSVPLAADGTFQLFLSAPTHVLIDLVGYWIA